MSEILFSNEDCLNQVIQHMVAENKEHFHVVTDFDRTLTKAFVDGKPRSSLESILEWAALLWAEYSTKSKQNFDKYYPIEIDPNISLEDKKVAMQEWWTVQFKLMIDSWLNKEVIQKTMQSEKIMFRKWHELFFSLLDDNGVPLIVFSASGLWYEGISYWLQSIHALTKNIHIISNNFIRNEQGKAIGIQEPIIHSFNKTETTIKTFPFYQEIVERKNVLLLGDSPGDVHMADGFDYENIIKIWFLNTDTPENRKLFLEKYDVVILNDGDMEYINELLKKILGIIIKSA